MAVVAAAAAVAVAVVVPSHISDPENPDLQKQVRVFGALSQ